ncbi:uncharacterized protein LOC113287459 [Papaver somniferum]|uniref:uncharacterized protein LOC113287459 n=1 Tax=Papaver somniferum TaxID=3469 RepID=UPI000E6F4BD0|nr:uncharacterized protein LOC113287459 [Papaver somniferum]
MHIPASDDCNPPPSLPGPSLTTIVSETLGVTISPMRERGVPETPDQLQASFNEIFDAYTEACQDHASEPPDTFADSLHDFEVKLIKVVLRFRFFKAVNPDIYLDVVKLPAIRSMLDLLNGRYHCGNLLAGFILCTFERLTDPDIFVPGQEEEATLFVKSLVELGALNVFVSTLDKFPVDAVHFPAVQTIAQMIFLVPELAVPAGLNSQLMDWVFKALSSPIWNDLKMHVLGLLNTLLMSSMENRREFGKMDAVIVVVNALSSLEEDFVPHEEYLLQTLFCCLLFLLECPDNIVRFAEAGGVQSMIGIIQQEDFGYCHGSAIVALDKAVEAYQSAYEEFVNDDLAFDTAFHPFRDMNPPSIYHEMEEIEEHQISLIASLIGGIAKTENSLLKKFEENDFERITWLMELYSEKVEAVTNHLKGKQSIDVILGYLWSSEYSTIQSRIKSQLTHQDLEMKHVEDSLSAYRDNIGNAGESVESPKTAMEECIDSLEVMKCY